MIPYGVGASEKLAPSHVQQGSNPMTNIIALGSIYLLLFFAFAAGIHSLAGRECSDWLASCPDAEGPRIWRLASDSRVDVPDEPDRR